MSHSHSIFSENTKAALQRIIDEWSSFADIDKFKAYELAVKSIAYYSADPDIRSQLRMFQDIENHWYKSLETGEPDYNVYDHPYILSDLWACWVKYSRNYLTLMLNEKRGPQDDYRNIVDHIGNIESVVDLGCGFGYTTAGLKEIFPSATVYGTNFPDGIQFVLASHFGEKYGFSVVDSVQTIGDHIDLVFASEYFEHIPNAVEHVEDVINVCTPRVILYANTFTSKSIGHFPTYRYGDNLYDGRETSRMFGQSLKKLGYKQIKTRCWNNRPAYWRKD